MNSTRSIVLLLILLLCAAVWAADAPAPTAVLPTQFAGWQLKEPVIKSADPSVADETNAPALREYGFQRLEKAAYTRNDGRKLTIKAAIFTDASGAYGAFTYYKTPIMVDEKIGGQASSLNNRVLFYQGNILVDAVFDKLTMMSAAELRELAGSLPKNCARWMPHTNPPRSARQALRPSWTCRRFSTDALAPSSWSRPAHWRSAKRML